MVLGSKYAFLKCLTYLLLGVLERNYEYNNPFS